MGLPGGMEWIWILVIILLLFGGKKIPELLRGVGKGVGELQKGIHEGKRTLEDSYQEEVHRKEETRAIDKKESLDAPTRSADHDAA
jgi:sec-independent protein translocase protein TatA